MRNLGSLVGVLSFASVLAAGCAGEDAAGAEPEDGVSLTQVVSSGETTDGIDLTGTWGSRVRTNAKITAPVIGASDAPVDLAIKLLVKRTGGQISADVQICSLVSDSPSLKIDYSKMLPFMKQTVSAPDFEATAGSKVPLPPLVFRVGLSEGGGAVDVDGDTRPGGLLPIVALGLIPIQTYAGISLSISMDATVRSIDLIDGTAKFAGTGKIFGSNSPLLTGGELAVEQTLNPTPFAAKHFAGDVSCAELLKKL